MPRKTPPKSDVLALLRNQYECGGPMNDTLCTEEIAEHFGCHHRSLYNHDKDTGPLYELWRDGFIERDDNGVGYGRFTWTALGGELSWNWS